MEKIIIDFSILPRLINIEIEIITIAMVNEVLGMDF